MSEAITFPRSGIWTLRSKSDARWNAEGQYDSLIGDPLLQTPTSAQTFIDELREKLGEAPPADLKLITLPFPRPKFERLFADEIFAIAHNQIELEQLMGAGGLSEAILTIRSGEISLGQPGRTPVHRFQAQFMGIHNKANAIWTWGWLCEEDQPVGAAALRSVRQLREYGIKNDIPEIIYSELAFGIGDDRPWFNVDYLATVATALSGADFYMRLGLPGQEPFESFWMIAAPSVFRKPENEAAQMANVILQSFKLWHIALQQFGHRQLICTYANRRGCKVTEANPNQVRIGTPSSTVLLVDFGPSGEISALQVPKITGSEPRKASWLGRLFGG